MQFSKKEILQRKIVSHNGLARILAMWRLADDKIVFTNGCFDLLHLGHVDYLASAAELGNRLIVGLNTDASVSKLKGHHRPITDQTSRAALMASLFFVDAVVFFDDPTPMNLIQTIKPDVLAKGADYEIKDIVGSDFVLGYGGDVKQVDLIEGYSTSAIEMKIRSSAQ